MNLQRLLPGDADYAVVWIGWQHFCVIPNIIIILQKPFVKWGPASCDEATGVPSPPMRVRLLSFAPGPFCRHDSLMPGLSLDHYTSPSSPLGPPSRWVATSENSMFLMSSPQEMGGCVHRGGDHELDMADTHHKHTVTIWHWFYF